MARGDQERQSFWTSLVRSSDKERTAKAERFELLVGFLGFFTLAALVFAVIAEVRGDNAVLEVLVLIAFGLALILALKFWRDA
jgi:Flp pilus assembly protein TadB